ncbi:MAG: hypothetical protein CM1200mP2_55410 [Planctomycetaceae bacterium]|nr:MAG: hypothetical protein CM1200mP2_55410 [Planctomycetaceae bacterium]
MRVVADDGMKVWHKGPNLVFDFAQVLSDDKEQQPEMYFGPGRIGSC